MSSHYASPYNTWRVLTSHFSRVGVIYGCRPNDDVPVVVAPSPLLERMGMITQSDTQVTSKTATAAEYVASRVKAVHASSTYGAAPGTKFKYKDLEIIENHADVPVTTVTAQTVV